MKGDDKVYQARQTKLTNTRIVVLDDILRETYTKKLNEWMWQDDIEVLTVASLGPGQITDTTLVIADEADELFGEKLYCTSKHGVRGMIWCYKAAAIISLSAT